MAMADAANAILGTALPMALVKSLKAIWKGPQILGVVFGTGKNSNACNVLRGGPSTMPANASPFPTTVKITILSLGTALNATEATAWPRAAACSLPQTPCCPAILAARYGTGICKFVFSAHTDGCSLKTMAPAKKCPTCATLMMAKVTASLVMLGTNSRSATAKRQQKITAS